MSITTFRHFRATSFEAQGLSPCTTWRSVGASTAGFFTESFIDELIHAAGLDPLKARIEMCAVPTYRKVLETVAEMSNWKGPLGNGRGAWRRVRRVVWDPNGRSRRSKQ